MSFEKNVVKSFRKVRVEIENIQHQISELKQKVEDIDKVFLKKEKSVNSVKRIVRKSK